METVALILAIVLGTVGFVLFFGILFYSQWRSIREMRQNMSAEERRNSNRISWAVLFMPACIAFVVFGGVGGSSKDVFAALILVGGCVLALSAVVTLVVLLTLWITARRNHSL